MSEHSNLRPTTRSERKEMERAISRYEEALAQDEQAMAFLRGRGLNEETIRTFRLGVVSDPIPLHRSHNGRLSIPYLDAKGEPLAVRFRCLKAHDHKEYKHGKYMSLPDAPVRTYNIKAIGNAVDELHVTEGEFDAQILEQCGFHAVAVPGADLFQYRNSILLRGFSRVWVWHDPDEAGAKLMQRIRKFVPQSFSIPLEQDVTDTYIAGGITGIEQTYAKACYFYDEDEDKD